MRHARIPLLLALLTAPWGTALAQVAAEVAAMNPPAFFVRDGVTRALDADTELEAGDLVRTGDGARVRLRLVEGSDVKLGAGAEFRIEALAQRDDGVFEGLMNVLRGAFRFTTSVLSQRSERDLQVRVATVTAGIRGTDVWGRSNREQDLVCLIEGDITVRHRDGEPQTMSNPLTFFVAPRGEPPRPIAPVDPEQLQQWAQETELREDQGVMESDGAYTLHLASLRDRSSADVLAGRLRAAGWPARVLETEVAGETWNRVSLDGFASAADARAAGQRLRNDFDVATSWVQRRSGAPAGNP